MATSMSQNLKEVMLKRKNWHAPVSMQLRERVSKDDLKDVIFTIDQIIVCNRVAKDEDGKIIMTKDGQKEIYQPQVYIAFDGDKYLSTKSKIMVEQLENISDQQLVFYEPKDVEVTGVKGLKVKLGNEKVPYGNGKSYDQPVLLDADE